MPVQERSQPYQHQRLPLELILSQLQLTRQVPLPMWLITVAILYPCMRSIPLQEYSLPYQHLRLPLDLNPRELLLNRLVVVLNLCTKNTRIKNEINSTQTKAAKWC